MDILAGEATRTFKYVGRHYRNDQLVAWIVGTFKTDAETRAAWETVKFIRDTWPDAERALRGRLIGVDEGEEQT